MAQITKAVLQSENVALRAQLAASFKDNEALRAKLARYERRTSDDVAADLRTVFTNYADAAAAARQVARVEHRATLVVRCVDGFEVRS